MALKRYILHLHIIPILFLNIMCLLVLLVNENFELFMDVHEAMDQVLLLRIDRVRNSRLTHNVR